MAARSRIQDRMRAEHLDEALAHLALDGWTIDRVHDWATGLGYTFSRSAWGRFAKGFLARWEDQQRLRLEARAFAREYAGEAGFELGDMAGYVLQKQVLDLMSKTEDSKLEPKDLMLLGTALTSVTRAKVQVEKLRQTQAKARLEAYEEVEARLRAELSEERPSLWEGLQAWLQARVAEQRALAEA